MGRPGWSFCVLNEAISDTEVQNWLLYDQFQAFRKYLYVHYLLLAPATRCENMQPHLFLPFFCSTLFFFN